MNDKPITHAQDSDLRLSVQAIQRAARRAWELAAQTGTAIVICRNGAIEHIRPQLEKAGSLVQEQHARYDDKS